ncbi:MAG: ATP-grasp domain-containing protein [Actinomycetota bacterium]|nr:ATP-grasp domain-containing protein [Actinomycetota bacterium]
MRALILEEGRTLAAIAATRALGRAGWTVGIGSPTPKGLAAASRYSSAWHRVPSPHDDVAGFLSGLNGAVQTGGYEICFGAGDAEVVATSATRDEIECVVPYASHENVMRAVDKLELAAIADRNGIAIPSTVEATDEACAEVRARAVVKARLHWQWGATNARLHPQFVSSAADASRAAHSIRSAGGQPMLQEWITGKLMAVAVVADDDHRVVAAFQQISDEAGPSSPGGNVRARSVPLDRALLTRIERFMSDLGWRGLAQLQFMRPDDGEPRLIDLNGRFYGSMALALGAGINLPATWAALATNRPVQPALEPVADVRYRWLQGDLVRALEKSEWGAPGRRFNRLRYGHDAIHPISDPDDRGPLTRYLMDLVPRFATRLARRPEG